MKEHNCKNLTHDLDIDGQPYIHGNEDTIPFWYDKDKQWLICVDSDYHCFVVTFCPHCGEKL